MADTCPFWGYWYPCFGFLVTSPLGFKAKVGSALFAFCGGECNVHSPRSTSSATLADLLAAGAQPVTSPHACAEVGLGSDSNGQSPGQKTNALPLCQWPGSKHFILWLNFNNPHHFQSNWSCDNRFKCFVFFLKFLFLSDTFTYPILGPLVPLFGFLVTSPLGFKARVGSKPEWVLPYLHCGGECNVHFLRSTSSATPADLLAAGAQPVTSPHACAEVGLGSDLNGQSPGQKMNALPLCQWPGSKHFILWLKLQANFNNSHHFQSNWSCDNRFKCFLFFFKVFIFVRHIHMSYFGATGTPFWISGDISSGFQSQGGFCLIWFFLRRSM